MGEQAKIIPQSSDIASAAMVQQKLNCSCVNAVSAAEEEKHQSFHHPISIGSQLKTIFLHNYIATILMPCIPAGVVVKYVHSNSIAVFCINFAAIAPSAAVLSVATNDLKIRSGEKMSALLNQTFG